MTTHLDRREVLAATALAGLGFWVSGAPVRDENPRSPLDKIRWACIGIDGKGTSDTVDAARNGDIVAICDIDEGRLDKAGKVYDKAAKFTDYRVLFDKIGKSIDAVTVSTPDHNHAAASALAMNLGKHCFCQKPLTRTVQEARRLGEIARKQKVATQMGNQGTAGSGLRKAAALIQAGLLGTVKEVHVWSNRPIWKQGGTRPASAPVPAGIHWDVWLGPSPERPYAPGYHPFSWRGFWDFGSGALGDMACHTFNLPFMALDLRDPTEIEAESAENNKEMFPKWSIIRFSFPARGKRPAVKVVWYDGGKLPAAQLFGTLPPTRLFDRKGEMTKSGSLIIGDKGSLFSPGDNGGNYQLIGDITEPKEVEYVHSPGHFTEFVQAIRGGKPAMSNFPDYAGPLTETILLGNLAVYAGKKVEWNAKELKAKGLPEVETLIHPVYRKGWTL
jgi:predicted dehydrogenase